MPRAQGRVAEGTFDVRNDGLVYMEAHATDGNKTVFYYLDKKGGVITREMPRQEYEQFVKGLSEQEKAVLQQSSRAYGKEINAARAEYEMERLVGIGEEVEKKRAYVEYLKGSRKGTQADYRQIKALEEDIKGLEVEAQRTIDDMVSNKLGQRRSLEQLYEGFQGRPVGTSSGRSRLVVSDDFDEAYKQVQDIGKRIESLEVRRAQLTGTGEVSPQRLEQVRGIDEELMFLKQEEASGIAQMERKGMGSRQTLKRMFESEKTLPRR